MTTADTSTQPTNWLRPVMAANALVCVIAGVALLGGNQQLSREVGLPPATLLGAGVVMVAYALLPAWVARTLNRNGVLAVTLVDDAWFTGSIAALFTAGPALTSTGRIIIAISAVAVFLFAIVQLIGWRRL